MLLFIRIFLLVYGIIAIITGFMGASASYDATITPMQDNNHRYVAAIWASMSITFFYVAWNPSEVALFRFLMIAVFIGGIVRALALVNYPPTNFLTFIILLELIPTVVLFYMHNKLLKAGII